MTTYIRDLTVDQPVEQVWKRIADVSRVNEIIDFLGDVTVDGDRRTCALGDRGALEELIVSIDDDRRRLAYTVVSSPLALRHHNASLQVHPDGAGTRVVWTTDVIADDAVLPQLEQTLELAVASLQRNLR